MLVLKGQLYCDGKETVFFEITMVGWKFSIKVISDVDGSVIVARDGFSTIGDAVECCYSYRGY